MIPGERAGRFVVLEHDADDVAFLQYTSGSTATPRGVKVTHANLLHDSKSIHRVGRVTDRTVAVNRLPSYHDMGLIGAILQPLFSGFPGVLIPPYAFLRRPVRWLGAISHFRGTASAFPSFALDLCTRRVTDDELARLDRFAERFARCGFRREAFVPVYGLAESTLIVSGERDDGEVAVRTLSKRDLTLGGVSAACALSVPLHTLLGTPDGAPHDAAAAEHRRDLLFPVLAPTRAPRTIQRMRIGQGHAAQKFL